MLAALIFAAAAAASPTQPAVPASTAAPAVTPAAVKAVKVVADKDDPVTCQYVEVTGTRFTEKHCMHKSEWERQAQDGKDEYEDFGKGGAIVPGK